MPPFLPDSSSSLLSSVFRVHLLTLPPSLAFFFFARRRTACLRVPHPKCFLLERFLHDIIFESQGPETIRDFLGVW